MLERTIFVDSSDLEEIKRWNDTGIIGGVTTNQSIMLKDGLRLGEVEGTLREICSVMQDKPVSVELTDSSASLAEMVAEAIRYSRWANNVVVKVPLIPATTKSLEVMHALEDEGIPVNVTCLMTFEQMITSILATCKNKQSFVSLFWARSIEDQEKFRGNTDFLQEQPEIAKLVGTTSDVNNHPRNIVREAANFIQAGGFESVRIIVGSIREATMVGDAFAAGANIVTVTPKVLEAMLFSQRTIQTIDEFNKAWKDLIAKSE